MWCKDKNKHTFLILLSSLIKFLKTWLLKYKLVILWCYFRDNNTEIFSILYFIYSLMTFHCIEYFLNWVFKKEEDQPDIKNWYREQVWSDNGSCFLNRSYMIFVKKMITQLWLLLNADFFVTQFVNVTYGEGIWLNFVLASFIQFNRYNVAVWFMSRHVIEFYTKSNNYFVNDVIFEYCLILRFNRGFDLDYYNQRNLYCNSMCPKPVVVVWHLVSVSPY